MIHKYNPFDSKRYRPEHFPMLNLTTGRNSLQDTNGIKTIDEYLLEEYIVRYPDVEDVPHQDSISNEVANRVQSTIEDHQG